MIQAAALVPLAGKALLWGGTAVGAAGGATAIGGYGNSIREEVLQGGPNADGKFNTNWWQNMWIDEQSLGPQYNKRQKNEVMNDPLVTQMQMQLGNKFLYQDGWDRNKTTNANAGLYKKSLLEDQRTSRNQEWRDQFESPQMQYEREQTRALQQERNQLRRDELAENSANRNLTLQLGQINARTAQNNNALSRELGHMQNATTLQLAQMDSDLADKRMAYDKETRRMDRRDRNIAQLMSGLGQLGGAFAL